MTIRPDVPLAGKTWFLTGGNARFYAEPKTADEFCEAARWAVQQHQPIFILGLGANTLISDEGFDGLVIRPVGADGPAGLFHRIEGDTILIRASAGVTIEQLIAYALDHGAVGFEEFAGIPGTVGGSVFINIHYFEHELATLLVEAELLNLASGSRMVVTKDWFEFGYDYSRLHREPHAVLSATFRLSVGDALAVAYARGRMAEIVRHRMHRYPMIRTCGSFFKNFENTDPVIELNGKKIVAVAYYLDQLGLKGKTVGKATVSYKHANMIVTSPGATSDDIVQLARLMQQTVHDAYGLLPVPECRLVGFSDYPLLQR